MDKYLAREIGVSALVKLCDRFYQHCFDTPTIDQFIRDHNDPHGERLGKWLYEMMDSSSTIWSDDLRSRSKCPVETTAGDVVVNSRQAAHFAAWNCVKRAAKDKGKRFSLHDSVIWMRLFFLSAKEEGLLTNAQFLSFTERFLDRFIGFYNYTASDHVQSSLEWALNDQKVAAYLKTRVMKDLP